METVFLNGMAMHTCGHLPKTGEKAPELHLVGQDLTEINLDSYKGHRLVLNIFPSMDTEVCGASVRHFNTDTVSLENTRVLCVSMDLPFAATRFCTANGIENVATGSGFRSDFGYKYGVRIEDGPMKGLYARALVIIDEEGYVIGTSLCEQITEEPDYALVQKILSPR